MAFFDELGKAISDKSKVAAGKVKDLTGVIQLKTKLSSEKEKINKAYINLGKVYYDRHEASAEEEYATDFEAIRTGLIKIAEIEDEIAELEGNRVCADCGAKVEKNALYCSKCGALMDESTASQTEEKQENIFVESDTKSEE